ncbi:MAG: FtsQ-type POTRA domain-containing protein, partial [Erysipelotrichaceae bacterium]|nr:FtsQ-type POTRA domain-containing protein [Erysipelotrichaceae bacterium]
MVDEKKNITDTDPESEIVAGQQLIRQRIAKEKERIKKLAAKSRKFRITVFTTLSLLIGGISWYFLSPVSKVGSINISGDSFLSREYIQQITGINEDSRFLLMIPIINEIKGESSPLIKNLKIRRGSDHAVFIEVEEMPIVGYIFDDKLEIMLGNGKRTDFVPGSIRNLALLPMFMGIEDEKASEIACGMALLQRDLLVRISEVRDFALSYDTNMVKFVMDDNYRVYTPIAGIEMLNQYLQILKTTTSPYRCILMDTGNNVAILTDCQQLEKMYQEMQNREQSPQPETS